MNNIINVLKKFTDFSGRSSRSEYWYFILFYYVLVLFFFLITFIFSEYTETITYIRVAVMLPLFIPTLALTIRRLHDTGKSGWMILINLIPFIGAIWFIVLMATDSDAGDNEYGPNPKLNNIITNS